MPLTRQKAREELIAQGVNPDEYDLSSLPEVDNSVAPDISQGRAALVTGRRAIAPILGGTAGWALGAALAPETMGASLLLPLAGSLLGGFGASKAQEAVLEKVQGEQDYAKGVAEIEAAREQHPVTSFLAGTAPMLLTGRPSLSEFTKQGVKGLARGAGINVASDVASQKLLEGNENIDWGRVGLSGLTGAAFNKPALLGRIGMSNKPTINPRSDELNNYPADPTISDKRRQLGQPTNPTLGTINLGNRVITPEYRKPLGLLTEGLVDQPQQRLVTPADETILGKIMMAKPVIDAEASVIPVESKKIKPDVSGGKVSFNKPLEVNNQGQVEGQTFAPEVQPTTKTPNPKLKTSADLTAKPGKALYQHESGFNRPLKSNYAFAKEINLVGDLQDALKSKVPIGEFGSWTEARKSFPNHDTESDPNDSARYRLEQHSGTVYVYDKHKAAYQAQSIQESLANNKGFQDYVNELAGKFKVKLEQVAGLKDDKGNPVAGVAYIQERLAQWNPEKAGIDTGLHEIGHIFARDLKDSINPTDRDFYNKGVEAFGKNEEALVEAVGSRSAEVVKAKLDKAYHKQALNWLKDFWSMIKTKWLDNGTADDYARLFSKKMLKGEAVETRPVDARYHATMDFREILPNSQPLRMYNLNRDVVNPQTGEVAHTKDSTVSEATLKKYGLSFREPEVAYQRESTTLSDDSPRRDNPITAKFNPFSSVLDKIAVKYGQPGSYVAKAFENFTNFKRDIGGKFEVELLQPIRAMLRKNPADWLYGTNQSMKNIDRYMQDMFVEGKSNVKLTPEEQSIVEGIRRGLVEAHNEQRADGPLVREIDENTGKPVLREAKDNPNYYPNKISNEVFDVFTRKPNSPEAQKLKQEFIAYKTKQYKGNTQVAEESFNRIFQRKGGEVNPDFNAVRLEEGVGLPESWRDKNLLSNLESYVNRFSNDIGFYRAVQKDPVARQLLNIGDDGRGNSIKATNFPDGQSINNVDLSLTPEVQSVMRQITRQYTPVDANINAVTKVVKANLLQTLTGLKDVITSPFSSFELLNFNELPFILKAYTQIADGFKAGIRRGVIKPNQILWQDHIDTGNKFSDAANNLSRIINKVTGRDSLEHFNRAHLMRLGQLVAESRIGANDTKFLNKFAQPNWRQLVLEGKQADVRDFAAANFVESGQGSYSIKGLPIAAQEGILSPFLSLAKWPIERFNNWEKNVILPARNGNIKPLLMSTLGAVLGGVAIEELTKLITGRKPQELTWEEYLGLGGQETPYKLAALASYSGYAGIVGDLTKSLIDLSHGNRARGLSFPLYDMFATGFKRIGQASEAMRDGEPNVLPLFIEQTLKDNVQLWRLMSGFINADDIERSNKFRDVRTFNRLEGLPSAANPAEENPFVGQEAKDVKRSKDLKQSITKQQDLVKSLVEKHQQQPELLQSKLAGLKSNSYQTIPNINTMPAKAQRYIQHIKLTQGEGKAKELIQDYLRQNAINRMKSLAVPSL